MWKSSQYLLSTDREIKAAKPGETVKDYRVHAAPGLVLRIMPSGTKSWSYLFKSPATGKRSKVALGQYPAIGLAEARELAGVVAGDIRQGKDPVHDKRKAAEVSSFAELAALYMREHSMRNERDGRVSGSTEEAHRLLNHDILPTLGPLKVEKITRLHILHVVEAVAERGALVIADRVLGLMRAIFTWGCGTGRLDRDPTAGLKKRNAGKAKTRVLSLNEIGIFWRMIAGMNGLSPPIRDALRLQLLTGARIGEVLEARRDEINVTQSLWVIAAKRTKSEREHVLPLSPLALSIFKDAIYRAEMDAERRAARTGTDVERSPWVFPSQRTTHSFRKRTTPRARARRTDGAFEPYAATRALRRCREAFKRAGIAEPFSTHDMRRTLATQLGEMGIADETIERILNHAPRTVAGKHYNHARYLPQMREALEAWAEKVEVTLICGTKL